MKKGEVMIRTDDEAAVKHDLSDSLAEIDVAALLDCLPDPAIIIGSSYRILAANQSYRRKFMGGERVRGRRCCRCVCGCLVEAAAGVIGPLRDRG